MSNKVLVNGFELQPNILIVDGKLAKVFLPYVIVLNDIKYFWVKYLESEEIGIVKESDLTITKNGKLLYE